VTKAATRRTSLRRRISPLCQELRETVDEYFDAHGLMAVEKTGQNSR
jgi:hypothetical protein